MRLAGFAALLLVTFWILLYCSIIGSIVAVAFHFIRKFWLVTIVSEIS